VSCASSPRKRARAQPEALIGEIHLNFWNFNMYSAASATWASMLMLHGPFAAQAGAALAKDKALCRLAARFALSLVHCEHWEDIFFACMRGSQLGPARLSCSRSSPGIAP
jgi:hypothetical protein